MKINLTKEQYINKIIKQTNCTKQQIETQLNEFNYEFITDTNIPTFNKPEKSNNQEVYRQIRQTLNESSQSFQEKNPIIIEHVVRNFKESDKNNKSKHSK